MSTTNPNLSSCQLQDRRAYIHRRLLMVDSALAKAVAVCDSQPATATLLMEAAEGWAEGACNAAEHILGRPVRDLCEVRRIFDAALN